MGSLLPGACKTDSFSAKENAAVSKISQAGHRRRRRRRRLRHHASKIRGFVITFPAFLNFSRLVLGDFDLRRVQQDEQVNDVSRGITNRLQLCKDERRQLQEQDVSKTEANTCKKLVLDYLKIKQERKHPCAKARKGKRNPDACHIEATMEPLSLKK
ncbi:hypothetical protein OPV22_002410 [Ensete ventricosum]|uniref:Uncharacterized protein n=1 Tax=Ensete ventricosum TaxID=4639 RepID=A0AAV8RXX7_ENSVE|nr:hypothetical protein OPV22_002410 [Ensete ventricosum]